MSRLWFALLILLWPTYLTVQAQTATNSGKFAIVIHGGAGGDPSRWSEEYRQQRIRGLQTALDLGVEMLRKEAAALDVVERVVRLIDQSEYKRRQAAPGLKVTSKAFGIGRRIPIAQRFQESWSGNFSR